VIHNRLNFLHKVRRVDAVEGASPVA
jgi:hypothetical protein